MKKQNTAIMENSGLKSFEEMSTAEQMQYLVSDMSITKDCLEFLRRVVVNNKFNASVEDIRNSLSVVTDSLEDLLIKTKILDSSVNLA